MRKLNLAVAISALVHTGALAFVVTRPVAPTQAAVAPPPTPIEVIEVPPPPPEAAPIDVAILDEHAPEPTRVIDPAELVTSAPVPHAPRARASTDGLAITTGPRETIGSPGTLPETHPGSSLLSMRKPRVDLTMPTATAKYDDLEHVPAGTTAAPDLTSGRLDPAGGGTYRTDDGVFVANVGADGSVKFKDGKNFHIHLAAPRAKDIGNGISAWYNDPNKPTGSIAPAQREKIALNNDNIEENFKKPDSGGTVGIIGGGFDVTDAFMRGHGQDPYASRKLAYLDSTRDERVQIGTKHRQQQLAQATLIMRKNLDRMWASVSAPAARKQALFEMWDECAESGAEDLVTAGAEARKLVIGFIRAHLPAGTASAYTSEELRAFNGHKASRATFSPYE